MKISQIISTLKNLHISKDKLLLLLLAGVLLVIVSLPVKGKNTGASGTDNAVNTTDAVTAAHNPASEPDTVQDYVKNLETGLEQILSKAEGAGTVKVFITLKDSGELIVEKDTKTGEAASEETVVFAKGGDGTLTPYVTKTVYPAISGVLVLAQGASDAGVAAAITEAVSTALGIDINKIKVMKMEG